MSAIECGPARPDEYPRIRDIVSRAFATPDEADLWDVLVARDPALTPDCVRVARRAGQIIACTVVLPRTLRGPRGSVPGGIVTLVACDPDYQGQGYGSASVRDALQFMRDAGHVLGILYGHRGYYPRFGFVPVLAGAATDFSAAALPPGETLSRAEERVLPALTALFTEQLGGYPCAVQRTGNRWLWQPRGSAQVVAVTDGSAYALLVERPAGSELRVPEACAAAGQEDELLGALAAHARRAGLETVSLRVPPDHAPARRARALGGATTITPPAAGMAVILEWEPLLPPGYRVEGDALLYREQPFLQAPVTALTGLVLGADGEYAGLEIEEGRRKQLDADFPARFPHWSLEPFWS